VNAIKHLADSYRKRTGDYGSVPGPRRNWSDIFGTLAAGASAVGLGLILFVIVVLLFGVQ
jgi:hypothetical protein